MPEKAWELFKHESGKHVVQRVPPTESKGRRHTSVVSVAVSRPMKNIPEMDIRNVVITTQRGTGKGGQARNKLETCVRAVHTPTGLSAVINSGRSQSENKEKALEILRKRVYEREQEQVSSQYREEVARQFGAGCRSGKVRTYSFIDGFVQDHNLGTRTSDIRAIMKGHFELILG